VTAVYAMMPVPDRRSQEVFFTVIELSSGGSRAREGIHKLVRALECHENATASVTLHAAYALWR
jgi:hypothetical protein